MLGLVLAAYIAFTFLQLRWITIQLLCIIALVVYSTTFKRKLVIGNVLIASLSSLAMLTLAWYEPNFPLLNTQLELVRYFWFYTVFAFFITLLREIVKDMEDIKGMDYKIVKQYLLFGAFKWRKRFYMLLLF
jgi:4-hydroxybenzoate polyprenyltransferase